ncbi:helix-turn-helix domain-containing protein [Pectinatus frisingensis]|uniref:helix-turn-helix domain-containing protein n=1 Tax=Pectinatus frisingensis TaxID=865 RepID=UPI003D801A34
MLFINLKVLLAERNIRITQLSKDTGISRTTITALCNNTSQGIQFDTLNKICNYLRITPQDFFLYAPYDYWLASIDLSGKNICVCEFEIVSAAKRQRTYVMANIDHSEKGTIYIGFSLPEPEGDEDTINENTTFENFYNNLPIPIKTEFENKTIAEILIKLGISHDVQVVDQWAI